MGSRYLTDLAAVLRGAGLTVVELDGWQTRARSSGGYDGRPLAVYWHHTAGSGDGAADARYCTFSSPDRPVCNVVVGRDGVVHVCAAGATNTNGKGGPVTLPSGASIPLDGANSRVIGMEISNNGVGMTYPQVCVDACFAVSVACAKAYGMAPDDVVTHQVWAPSRKIDPATAAAVAGPWRPGSVTSSGTWDQAALRAECRRRAGATPTPQPPTPDPEDDDMTTWLVVHPRTGEYLATDLATFATYVPSGDVAGEGRDTFGWRCDPSGGPWGLAAPWGAYLDQLPRTAPG